MIHSPAIFLNQPQQRDLDCHQQNHLPVIKRRGAGSL
uniref:Uncharacterized protein n=1 Tax=Timema tahoe TaxID=61484 RepID=A0A7R9IS28_9NEOP|nr:unnamed protein product [Timema tahoe]